jgi:hypothetical protein
VETGGFDVPRQPTAALTPANPGYDYALLDPSLAQEVRAATVRIHGQGKQTLLGIVGIGLDLILVKQSLPHGQYLPWLQAEFGWTEGTAHNYVRVAKWLGAKRNLLSHLNMMPTAAYLLAAKSAPESARQAILERAARGELITPKVVREILSPEAQDKRKTRKLPGYRLRPSLAQVLERYRQRWQSESLAELADQLREFADALEVKEDR